MVRKKLAIAVLALGAMQADLASALGLGSVAIKSQLNQPLDAEIRLLETGDLDAAQVRVRLAAAEDFQRAGVERDYFLNNLQFTVELDQRGGGVVRVTTREAVVEPYLNFVIEARWPSGRLLREYAVLLDPPTFSADATPPAPRTGSGLATVQQHATQAPVPTYTAPRGAAPAGREFPPAGDGEYRIQSSDTLSGIASRFRPAGDASVEQTMLAIQQANPNAFIRNNINLIKAGYVLRLPDADEVRSIGLEMAAQEVLAQNEAWRTGSDAGRDSLAAPQLDARSGSDRDVAGTRAAERLSIAGAGDADRGTAGDGTGAQGGAGVAALQNELLAAQEGLDSSRRDNEELQSRLDDMERQIATLQKLLTLKDDQLAALQESAGSTVETGEQTDATDAWRSPEETAAALVDAGSVPAGENDVANSEPAEEAATEEDSVAVVPPPAVERQSSVPKVTSRRPPEPDLWERLLGNPWLPAGAAALIALLAGGIYAARRRRAQAEAEAEALAELEMAERAAPAPAPEVAAAPATAAAVVAAAAVSGAEPEQTVAEAPVVAPVRAETGDVVAEADIYIAYGRYQQAVNLLSGAIQQEPARTDIRVKLLEVYLEMRDREAFRQEFVALQALGDEEAVVQVKEMLSSVDGVADWLNGLPGGSSGAFAAGFAAATAAAAAAPTDSESDADELFADSPDEAFALELDDSGAVGGDALDLDWLNENGATSTEDDGEGFVLDLGSEDDTAPESEAAATHETAFDFGGPLELDEQALDADIDAAVPVEEPAPAHETAPAAVLGELDLDDDALDFGDDDLDRALSELEGDSGDALSAAFGNLDADELGSSLDDGRLDDSGLGIAPAAELEPLDADAAPAEAPLDVDAEDDFTLELGDLEADVELPVAPEDVPQRVVEPVPYAVEGLGDLDHDALDPDAFDDDATLDELAGFDAPAPVVSADALDAAFADFEALGAELDAESSVTSDDSAASDFTVDLDSIAPYTPETAAADEGDEFDFLADADEVATKLDLARAYIDMGDTDGARDILGEVVQEGTDPQREEAQALLERIV